MATVITPNARVIAGFPVKMTVDPGHHVELDLSGVPEGHQNPGVGGIGPRAPLAYTFDAGGTAGTMTLTASLFGRVRRETMVTSATTTVLTVGDVTGFAASAIIIVGAEPDAPRRKISSVSSTAGTITVPALAAAPAAGTPVRLAIQPADYTYAVDSSSSGGAKSGVIDFPVAGLRISSGSGANTGTGSASFLSVQSLRWARTYT